MESFKHKFKSARTWVNTTDVSIGITSLTVGSFFILIASVLDGIYHDLFISLSASIYSVGFTIATVDGLRKKRKKDSNLPALENALRRISGSNTALALTLAAHARKKHEEILVKLVRSSGASIAYDQAMIELSQVDTVELLKYFPEDKLDTDFASIFERVSSSLMETYTRYDYLLGDAIRSHLNELIEQSEAAAKMAKISKSLGKDTMDKIIVSTDKSKRSLSSSKASVLPSLSKYLDKYAEFVKLYINT